MPPCAPNHYGQTTYYTSIKNEFVKEFEGEKKALTAMQCIGSPQGRPGCYNHHLALSGLPCTFHLVDCKVRLNFKKLGVCWTLAGGPWASWLCALGAQTVRGCVIKFLPSESKVCLCQTMANLWWRNISPARLTSWPILSVFFLYILSLSLSFSPNHLTCPPDWLASPTAAAQILFHVFPACPEIWILEV